MELQYKSDDRNCNVDDAAVLNMCVSSPQWIDFQNLLLVKIAKDMLGILHKFVVVF